MLHVVLQFLFFCLGDLTVAFLGCLFEGQICSFPGSFGVGSAAASEIAVSKMTLGAPSLTASLSDVIFGCGLWVDSRLAVPRPPGACSESEPPGTVRVSALEGRGQHPVSLSEKQELLRVTESRRAFVDGAAAE